VIELRTLGALDLRDAESAEVRSVIAQPKRLAPLLFHSDPDLETLRGYPPFTELLRPKG
jgi:hypothetical protein